MRSWLLACALFVAPMAAYAQAVCMPPAELATPVNWAEPLARRVTLRAADITLADALNRLAAAAHIRFSYSADALPLQRRVCLSYNGIPVGRALVELLHGTTLEPVVAGAEHVVLAPVRERAATRPSVDEDTTVVVALEQVVVRGDAQHAARTTSPVGAVVIDGRDLARRGSTTLADALNGAVPGMWMWHEGGGSLASYGSMRGASSFRAPSPKVYIDGIEVANSQLLTRISPATIERIEIIRGPQGAALYGANALSGVVNIITRRDHVEGATPLRSVESRVSVTTSDFSAGSTLSQDHSLSMATGRQGRSTGVNLSIGTLGAYVPGAGAQHVSADAFGRLVGSRSVITATLRFLSERSGSATNPLLPDSLRAAPLAAANAIVFDLPSMRQFTAGVSAALQPGSRWKHTALFGVDGYGLDPANDGAQTLAPGSTDLFASALRATARVTSVRPLELGNIATGALTFAVEHSVLRQSGELTTVAAWLDPRLTTGAGGQPEPQPAAADNSPREQRSSTTGLSTQSHLLWHDRVMLTGGLRFERSGSMLEPGRWATLPMLGGAVLASPGPIDIKLRTAYGRAIRWQTTPGGNGWQSSRYLALREVQPAEEQSGVEAGVDLRLGGIALQVTRFDQVATGVTQPSATSPSVEHRTSSRPGTSAGAFQYPGTVQTTMTAQTGTVQSIGTIRNRGWELEGSLSRGRFGIGGSLAFVDSRVRSLARGYDGDLRAGDRMLAVPARTASLSASWTDLDWSASVTAARAADWINYDRLALLADAAATDSVPLSGAQLRSYWRGYQGFTHLNATAARRLAQRFTLTLTGANLLGGQVNEPDNLTIVPGRTISIGVRATF